MTVRACSMFSPVSDVVLASFADLLADNDLCDEFMVRWRTICDKLSGAKVRAYVCQPSCVFV